jgi:hypothetical protein
MHTGSIADPWDKNRLLKMAGIQENNINQYVDNSHKSKRMYGTTDDTLGRRLFQVQKEKAVEDALEKIRRTMGPDWGSFSSTDCAVIKETLGEIWTSIDRPRWATYCFSKLSKNDISSLITIGKVVKAKPPLTNDVLKMLDNILSRTI